MRFRDKQIAPPSNWTTFEDLCHALFKKVWQDPLAQKNGRRGQPQCGVDVFGSRNGDRQSFCGVQCKGKDANYGSKAALSEITAEIAKAESFAPPLEHWVFATTAPVDGRLQEAARELTIQRKRVGLFGMDVLGWQEIQTLMAEHPDLIREFYPEHADHLPEILEALQVLPSISAKLATWVDRPDARSHVSANCPTAAKWEVITFETDRGLGPALLGRPMGPSDAIACPRLLEADMLASQLKIAHSARLRGEPGVGKSICSYQTARDYAAAGYEVLRLTDPQAETIDPPQPSTAKRLLFIDNAHLMPSGNLARLEENAAPDRLLLSTHSVIDQSDLERGSVTLNAKRAVHTIASAFRADLPRTLSYVRVADDRVGDRMLDEDLSLRIDQAEKIADRPWQFCFILGGGWRRSRQAADAAQSAGADFVLAAVAIRQLASRDAIAVPNDVVAIYQTGTASEDDAERHLEWLERERLILGFKDCRTPHQRFASVVLNQILAGQDVSGRQRIGLMIDSVLTDPQYPLAGLRNLLHEIWFGIGDYRWSRLPQRSAIQTLAARCWQAKGKERGFAALTLTELRRFLDDADEAVIEPHAETFSRWISNPFDGAYGFARLLNDISNEVKPTAKAVFRGVKPAPIAQAYSNVSLESAYGLANLMRALCSLDDGTWRHEMKRHVDSARLLNFASNDEFRHKPYLFGPFCSSVTYWNEDLALAMAEEFIPSAQAALAHDPIHGFRDLAHEFLMPVLRVYDPLQVYVGKFKPDRRRMSIARCICKSLDAELVAHHISGTRIRDYQSAAGLLHLLYRCVPTTYDHVIRQIDFGKLSSEIAKDWANPSHETVLLLGSMSLSDATRKLVSDFIASHANRIEEMPPRLVLLAPRVGTEHLQAGKKLRLAQFNHVAWESGAIALALIGEDQPELVPPAATPFVDEIAKGVESYDRNYAGEAEFLIHVLLEMAPTVWKDILFAVDTELAEKSLANCLAKGGAHRRAAALVVDSALQTCGPVGQLARRLRKRFPKSSIPSDRPPTYVSRRRRRARRQK